jgi:hypothetical protein
MGYWMSSYQQVEPFDCYCEYNPYDDQTCDSVVVEREYYADEYTEAGPIINEDHWVTYKTKTLDGTVPKDGINVGVTEYNGPPLWIIAIIAVIVVISLFAVCLPNIKKVLNG